MKLRVLLKPPFPACMRRLPFPFPCGRKRGRFVHVSSLLIIIPFFFFFSLLPPRTTNPGPGPHFFWWTPSKQGSLLYSGKRISFTFLPLYVEEWPLLLQGKAFGPFPGRGFPLFFSPPPPLPLPPPLERENDFPNKEGEIVFLL